MPLNVTVISVLSSSPRASIHIFGKITKYDPLCSCSFLFTVYSCGNFVYTDIIKIIGRFIYLPMNYSLGELKWSEDRELIPL